MSSKEQVIAAVRNMPDDVSIEEIVRRLRSMDSKLKSLLLEGLAGEPIEITEKYWQEMVKDYENRHPETNLP